MSNQFYCFINAQSYHFFTWLTEGGAVSTQKLVEKAFDQVEDDEWHEIGENSSVVARDKLAEILDELLRRLGQEAKLPHVEYEEMHPDDCENIVSEIPDSLFGPILQWGVEAIDTRAVAKALLILHNKWFPDKEPPEVL